MADPTTLSEAAKVLKGKKVTAITTGVASGVNQVTGSLKLVGNDFIDVEWSIGKSTLIPFAQLASLKEE